MRPLHEYEEVDRLIRWGLSTRGIAKLTGIPRCTVRDWRRKGNPRTRPKGKPGPKSGRSPVDCPICGDADLPGEIYAYLLGIYLGDGYLSAMPRGVFKLRVFQDQRYKGIIREIASAMSAVRTRGNMSIGYVWKTGCVEITAHWKHWPCLFPQHGSGQKHTRPIKLQSWQDEIVARLPGPLLRGLIHSDGYRGLNWVNGKGYPRYQFTNHSDDIRRIFCRACDQVGVRWRQMNWKTISVAKALDVSKLDEFIGSKK